MRVEVEEADGGLTDIRGSDDARGGQAEMLVPVVIARVIQADEAGRASNEGTGIGSLRHIAAQAGKSEVRGGGSPTLFPADDVIDVEGEAGVFLMNQAVFTDSVRPLDDEAAKAG